MSYFSVIKGLITGDIPKSIRLDASTETMQVITYEHHEVHAGCHFFYTDSVSVNSDAAQNYLITTPDTTKWAHFVFDIDGLGVTDIKIYEGGDRVGTSGQTIFNSDRNSATSATTTIHKWTSTGSTDGNLIYSYKSGSDTNQSRTTSQAEHNEEIILKQNTKYLIVIASTTNSNLINCHLSWYEHTNRS